MKIKKLKLPQTKRYCKNCKVNVSVKSGDVCPVCGGTLERIAKA